MSGHVHPQECCCDVEDSFQPYARAIPVALDVASWNISGKITVDAHHYKKTIRKQPMQINPRRRNKNLMIDVLVDQKRNTRNVADRKRDRTLIGKNNNTVLFIFIYIYLLCV